MASHVIDSAFFRDLYGTERMRAIFEDRNLLQKWLNVEAALAVAEAQLGVIPPDAASAITRAANAGNMDLERIKAGVDHSVHPLMAVVRELAQAAGAQAGEFVHWGATTQDIMDTADVLQIKDAMVILDRGLADLSNVLSGLARKYRDTVMPGRTHGQHALPITFGFKTAVWLDEVLRHRQRLADCRPRVLVGQFAGAAGTLASLGPIGLEVQQHMMTSLGLAAPTIAWHSARDGFAEFVSVLGMIAATMGKIAGEIIELQKTEIGEVEEPFHAGKIGSSTMPHKRNPMLCEAIEGLALLVMNDVPSALDGMLQEHERDMFAWQMEWAYLPQACIMCDGAISLTTRVLGGLRVHEDVMARNLDQTQGLWLSEAVMLDLGQYIGRQTAHDLVYECAMKAIDRRQLFRDILLQEPKVTQHLSDKKIDALLDPRGYTGLCGTFVDRVLAKHAQVILPVFAAV